MRNFILVSALIGLTIPSSAAAGGGGKVAILDIQTTGVDAKYVNLLTELLTVEVEAVGRFDSVIAGRDVATMLGFERQKDLVGCDDSSCLAELGGALGVDRIIASHVGKLGTSFIVQIKLINIVEQRPEKRIYETVKGDEDVLIQTIKECVKKLVDVKAPGSTAAAPHVHAKPAAKAKPAPAAAKPPPSAQSTASVKSGGGAGATPWLLMGIGAVAAGAGAYFGIEATEHYDLASDPSQSGSQAAIAKTESAALLANVSFGVGAASAATALILWMFSGDDGDAGQVGMIPLADGFAVSFGGEF